MLKVLTLDDINLIDKFFIKLDKYNEAILKNIEETIGISKIICASINKDEIDLMIIVNIINNQYYIGDIIENNNTIDEIKELLRFTVDTLKDDERGLNIIYDNFPYKEIMNNIFKNCDFKCSFINFVKEHDDKIYPIKNNININDKTDDVREYLYSNYVDVLKSNMVYMNEHGNLPTIDDIHLDNTNMAIVRDDENKVIGVARFSLITDSIFINSLYANSDDIYIDLINLISNLTNRKLEIGLYPVREHLMEILKNMGFIINNADYLYKID